MGLQPFESLRSADVFLVVASLPPKRSDDRKYHVFASQANGTKEAKKKKRKPGIQSTGGWNIPDAPPPAPPKKYCMSYKDFSVMQEMRDRSLLFCSVIGDSRLNATCSFACVQKSPISFVARGKGNTGNRRQLVRQNLLKTRHWWVAQINLLKKMYLVEDSCLFLLNLKKKNK